MDTLHGDGDGDGGARLPTSYLSPLHLSYYHHTSYSTPELEIIIVVVNILRYLYIYQ